MKIAVKQVEASGRAVVGGVVPAPSQVPRALEQLGQTLQGPVAGSIESMRDAADDERVTVEMQAISAWKDEYVDRPQTGYLAKEGMEARGVSEEAIKRFDALVEERARGLASERQRIKFKEKYTRQREALSDVLMAHEGREIGKATDAAIAGALTMAKTDAARAAAYSPDPQKDPNIASARIEVFDAVDKRRKGRSWEDPGVQAELLAETTDFHARVLDLLMAKERYTEATGYLVANEKEISGKASGAYRDELRTRSRAAEDVGLLDGTWTRVSIAATDPGPGKRFDPAKARADFEKNTTPEVRARIKDQFETRLAKRVGEQDEEDKQRLGRLYMMLDALGEIKRNAADYVQLDDVGKAQARRMEKAFQREQKTEASADRREQDYIDATSLDEALSLDPGELAAMDENALKRRWPDVARRGMAKLTKARQRAKQIVERGLEVPYGQFMSQVGIAAMRMEDAGTNAKRIHDFKQIMIDFYHAQPEGKPPTDKQVGEMIAQFFEIKEKPGFFGPTQKPANKIDPKKAHEWTPAANQNDARVLGPPQPDEPAWVTQTRAAREERANVTRNTPDQVVNAQAVTDPKIEALKAKAPAGTKMVKRGAGYLYTSHPKPGDEVL